ncbi:hypothetical protein ACVIN2_005208 [Bradyrhizobium sp. USDA 3650]
MEVWHKSEAFGRTTSADATRTVRPLPLAGEGWGGGVSASGNHRVEKAPTRHASRVDLPRKRERLQRGSA